jgi:hypothetical protein
MWVMTTEGFYSAVEDSFNKEYLIVRSRQRKDLVNLLIKLELPIEISENVGSDYRWRVWLTKWEWAKFLHMTGESIDYPNFKNKVHSIDAERAKVYGEVWAVLYALQPWHAMKKKNRKGNKSRRQHSARYLEGQYDYQDL